MTFSTLHIASAFFMSLFSFKKVKQCKLYVKYLTLLSLCFFSLNCATNSPKFFQNSEQIKVSENAVNINTASVAELKKLPHVGAKTAAKIIEHRKRFGDFRRPAHLLLVTGISDQRFRNMRSMIKVK